MAASNFLELVNEVLGAFNEVELTSSNFATVDGFHKHAKNFVNRAIYDVYTYEQTEWPFAYSTNTFSTTALTSSYTKPTTYTAIDWDSFKIKRDISSVSSLTQVGGIATVVTSTSHNFKTGDNVDINGATPDGYNGSATITVVDSTTFTYTVASTLTSPATGTITVYSNTIMQSWLSPISIDRYRQYYEWRDVNQLPDNNSIPAYIVRDWNNSFVLTPTPSRQHTVEYAGFTVPTRLVLYSDTHNIPEQFEQVIIDGAMHYAYMFRDNVEEAGMAKDRFLDSLKNMRRILIPQDTSMRI